MSQQWHALGRDVKGKSLLLYFIALTNQDLLSFLGGLCLLEFLCGGRSCSWDGNGEAFAKPLCERLSGPVVWAGPDKVGLEGPTPTTSACWYVGLTSESIYLK